jgi:hypothetical protein
MNTPPFAISERAGRLRAEVLLLIGERFRVRWAGAHDPFLLAPRELAFLDFYRSPSAFIRVGFRLEYVHLISGDQPLYFAPTRTIEPVINFSAVFSAG